MDFYRVRKIKKSKKEYKCYLCNNSISEAEEHYYISGRGDDDFFNYRCHDQCFEKAKEMCSFCLSRGDCISDIGACFRDDFTK